MTQIRLPSAPAWCVFTDGSCWHEDRIGGWAWVAFHEEMEPDYWYENRGIHLDTTISVMELMAPMDFLMVLRRDAGPQKVLVMSDAEYVVKGAMDRSRSRNKNRLWWNLLDRAVDQHQMVVFEHVRGHSKSYYNHQVDRLAHSARKAGQNFASILQSS